MAAITESESEMSAAEKPPAKIKHGYDAKGARRPADSRLRREINARLKSHPDLDGRGIDVRVRQGEVVLLGSVSDAELKRLAETIAGGIEGVQGICNKLVARFDGVLLE